MPWRAVFALAFCLALASLTLSGQPQDPAPPPTRMQSAVVISEVLFDPTPGDTPFVELLNAGSSAVDLRGMVLKLGDAQLPLYRLTTPLAPGTRMLIRLDGERGVDGLTYHAPGPITLDPTGGTIVVVDDHGTALDRVAWGNAEGGIHATDDLIGTPEPGRTIGRGPGANRPFSRTEWATYPKTGATPGAPNLLPQIGDLLPDDGDSTEDPAVVLDWRPVTGAASYHYQVTRAGDRSFVTLTSEGRATAPFATLAPLSDGQYVWRVQPIDQTGAPGPFSEAARFEVSRPGGTFPSGAGTAFGLLAYKVAPTAQAQPVVALADLPVPLILQHKDTHMLQLENPKQDDPHGWDRDHQTYDHTDPADQFNCVVASVAMITRFLGGNLSQDRIGYEVLSRRGASYAAAIIGAPNMSGLSGRRTPSDVVAWLKELQPGPEWDLLYGDGLNPGQVLAAIDFAFQSPGRLAIMQTADEVWGAVKTEIDARRPVIISSEQAATSATGAPVQHARVIRGYGIKNGKRFFTLNNPARQGIWHITVDDPQRNHSRDVYYFLPPNPNPRTQEASVSIDSDGDGAYDFDEVERFHTDPHNRDTDGDGLEDGRIDIAFGVFDPRYGYALHTLSTLGRDFDGDGVPTELDPDSDDGGCKDGVEDADWDGTRSPRETWNFDDRDDLCRNVNGHINYEGELYYEPGDAVAFTNESLSVVVSLKPKKQGEFGPLLDTGRSWYRMRHTTQLEITALLPDCPNTARTSVAGHGPFGQHGDEIGGNLSPDELVIAAGGHGRGDHTVDSCLVSGTDPWEDSLGLPSCVGTRVANSRTYQFNCITPPPPPATMRWAHWFVVGSVTLDSVPEPMQLRTGWPLTSPARPPERDR